MGPLQRADDLAVRVFWFLGDHWLGYRSPTDEEVAELRCAAFHFWKEAYSGDPLLAKAGDMADAVLELLSPLRGPDSAANLKNASDAYQRARFCR
ncbi:hypothetical protein AWC05_05210 [Mycobacterium florentinum]|uniref:Uncharacterized protein n=1 Tax=Mycobacterium florentinum TaxID=292462 RepID=A0A1X1TTV8_MYCFL|nr:hypothetical protein [Mycobacterium florentinum]MCV7408424.1 hypothetical protein [Mycobacterium florentinum]ORV47973.1 hypothetical protein AWC05_05210 [Mycobacterium florentinum]BBX78082.1 hypothetical protein MFLOJ_18690 [Mycobacterium florentinum]